MNTGTPDGSGMRIQCAPAATSVDRPRIGGAQNGKVRPVLGLESGSVRPSILWFPSHPLEDGGDALATADAHRHERVAATDPLQLVNGLGGDDRARRTDRMAERDT